MASAAWQSSSNTPMQGCMGKASQVLEDCNVACGRLCFPCTAVLCDYGGMLRSRRRGRSVACRAQSEDGEGGFEVEKAVERVLKNDESQKMLDSLADKFLQDEESKALLKDFATAAERVAKAKQDLESIDRQERALAEMTSQILARAADEGAEAASLVAEKERDVLAAEEELKAAELALVTARAGDSMKHRSRKWANEDIDEDLERVESVKAAAVSALAGTLASIPFLLTRDELGVGSFLSIGGVVASCALFGVTYRYILRQDLENVQLKSGAAAAFALVRGGDGIGQVDAIQLQVGYPREGVNEVMQATLYASKGLFIFGFAALALDYCLREAILNPFPCKKA